MRTEFPINQQVPTEMARSFHRSNEPGAVYGHIATVCFCVHPIRIRSPGNRRRGGGARAHARYTRESACECSGWVVIARAQSSRAYAEAWAPFDRDYLVGDNKN